MTRVRLGLICGAAALASLVSFACPVFHPVTPAAPDGGFADASPGTVLADCSDAALHAAELQIIPDIEADLALAPAASVAAIEAYVATLAIQIGGPLALAEAACAIRWCIAEAAKQFTATADSIEARKVANGRAWLAKHPAVTFADAGAP